MDQELKLQLEHATREAREIEQEIAAEPVPRRDWRGTPRGPQGIGAQVNSIKLRDLLACAFAANGYAPEEIYEAADATLKFRGD